MEVLGLRRSVLCVYECLRLAFLVGAFVLLMPEGIAPFPWLALIAPGAMFFLMALFWRLRLRRYRPFAPLFIAGKALSVIMTVFWIFLIKSSMMSALLLSDVALLLIPGVFLFLVIGDALSVWAVVSIFKSREREVAAPSEPFD